MRKTLQSVPMIGFMLFILLQTAVSQTKEIKGKITDARDGAPIAGASIQTRDGTASTISGDDGSFLLHAPSNATIVISFVGFKTVERPAGADFSDIRMEEGGSEALSEVVVVGYGTKIKKDLTSSIARVTAKEFENLPLPSFEQALQGRTAGVFINSGSGKLGQGLNVRVRGISSISANQQPLVVIDGVPVLSQAIGSYSEPDNPLASINPDDIASIEVLKDAASAAIYGARASNGVLLVTTKSGKAGKTKISLGSYVGWSRPTKKGEFLNAAQYRELFTAAADYRGFDPAEDFFEESATEDWNSTNDSKWTDAAFQNGGVQQYNLNINGGDERTRFLISGSWNDQKGIIITNRLKRGNARINLDHNLNRFIRIGLNVSLAKNINNRLYSDNSFTNPLQLNALPPIQAMYNADGTPNENTIYYNNLVEVANSKKIAINYRSISNAYAELQLTKDLMFRSQVGLDWNNLQEENYQGRKTLDGGPGGLGDNNQVTSTIVTYTNTLNYNKLFNDQHALDGLLGIEYQRGDIGESYVAGRSFADDRLKKINSAAIITTGSSELTSYSFASYFAKANYKFNDRYLLGASFRVDGSSRFGRDNRYGAFPAASIGWIISEENFLRNSSAISFLKIRSSYGKTGNAEIGNFKSRSLYNAQAYADISGIIASQIGVPTLSWEKTNQFDVGLDFGFLNNRISGEIDYFDKDTKDLLLDVPLPSINGFTVITQNIGSMRNKGWELTLNGTILKGPLSWTASVNISTYRNKITKLVAPVPSQSRTLSRLEEGQPFGQFYGLKYAGVDPANGDALYYKADGSKTNQTSEADDMILGNPNPDFFGGFNNRFSYAGFDLDIQCQFVKGGDIYNMAGIFQSVNGYYYDNQTIDQMNFWRKPGDITDIPQPRLYESNGRAKSSRWVQDGSYFRIKTVNLGYNFPKSMLSRLKIENARLYVAGLNLFTFTKYTGYDPEVSTFTNTSDPADNIAMNHDFYTPPPARTISVGLNIGL